MDPKTRKRSNLHANALAATLLIAVGCSSSDTALPIAGGGEEVAATNTESEPNNGFFQATALPVGEYGVGDVDTAGDADFWSMTLTADTLISVEVFGARLDQATWDGNGNSALVSLYDTDGSSVLVEHDPMGDSSDGWAYSPLDFDIPMFMVPADGTYYVAVTQTDSGEDGGAYAVRVKELSSTGMQSEAELTGVSGTNDTYQTAEPITPGLLRGFLVSDEEDYFSFTITEESVVRFEVMAYQNGLFDGGDYVDASLWVYDTDGETYLFRNGDSTLYDPAIDCLIVYPGTYYVAVTDDYDAADGDYYLNFDVTSTASGLDESEPNGAVSNANSIEYGSVVAGSLLPFDADVFKFEGKAGDMVRAQIFDEDIHQTSEEYVDLLLIGPDGTTVLDTGGESQLRISSTILQSSGTHYAVVYGSSPAVYSFCVELFDTGTRESEPNDVLAASDVFDAKGRTSGVIATDGDVDLVEFAAVANTVETISIFASSDSTGTNGEAAYAGHGSRLYPRLRILDSSGTELALANSMPVSGTYTESISNLLATASVSFVVPATGTYHVEVSDGDDGFSARHYYVLMRN